MQPRTEWLAENQDDEIGGNRTSLVARAPFFGGLNHAAERSASSFSLSMIPNSRACSWAFLLILGILAVSGSKGRACEGLGGLATGGGGKALVRSTRGAWEDSEEEPVAAMDVPGDRNELPEAEDLIEIVLGAFEEPDVVLDFDEPSERKATRMEASSLARRKEGELGGIFMNAAISLLFGRLLTNGMENISVRSRERRIPRLADYGYGHSHSHSRL